MFTFAQNLPFMPEAASHKSFLGIDRRIIALYAVFGLGPGAYTNLRKAFDGELPTEWSALWPQLLMDAVFSVAITLVISVSVTWAVMWLQRVLPWQGNFWKRIGVEFVMVMGIGIAWTFVYAPLLQMAEYPYLPFKEVLFRSITTTVIMGFILVSLYEGIFLFGEWKRSLVRAEQLEKENAISRYESLKNQVNPHFLFNSLSVLSGLVQSDPKKAEAFIDDFSSVYRYVLDNKDASMVTLREELDFIRSFLHLQQMRFDERLQVSMNISPELLDHHLPPLSLQMLVENALKHNAITRRKPLHIQIYDRDGFLVVENNLQPRQEAPPSTGVGLANLKARYAMFPGHQPEFCLEADRYVARLPLVP